MQASTLAVEYGHLNLMGGNWQDGLITTESAVAHPSDGQPGCFAVHWAVDIRCSAGAVRHMCRLHPLWGADAGQATAKSKVKSPNPLTAFPCRPPRGLVTGRFASCVLFQDEHDLYVQTWHALEASYRDLRHHADLQVVCQSEVLMRRILVVAGRRSVPRLATLYHAAFWRQQKARRRLRLSIQPSNAPQE